VEDSALSDRFSLGALLNAAPDGFIVAGTDGLILWANRTAEEMFGYEHGSLAGLGVEALVPERLRTDHLVHRAGYVNDPRTRSMGLGLDLQARRKDGSEFPVEIGLSPVEAPSGTLITAIIRDITDRVALESEHNRLEIELEMERERDRIAMDLHDGIMQDIYAASLSLELAVGDAEDSTAAAVARVERTIGALHDVVRSIRSYIFDLRPRQLTGNLSEALSGLAHEFQENSQIATRVRVTEEIDLDYQRTLVLYHIAHEGLSNVRKHAQASNVEIVLAVDGDHGCLEVRDDGLGFDPATETPDGHHGLRNMRARAHSISAEYDVVSSPGEGCVLSVRFPLAPG
jgi:PAS domain S-box-containing protein